MKDLFWLKPDGSELVADDWSDPENRVLGMLISGEATDEVDERGRLIKGDTLLLLLNSSNRSRYFTLPTLENPGTWTYLVHTARRGGGTVRGEGVQLVPHSLILLRRRHRKS
jgi:glycogen operon protein